MGLPNINIVFKQVASTAMERGERGIVALIIVDGVHTGLHVYNEKDDVPSDFSDYNRKQILDAFIGNVNAPIRVIVYVQEAADADYTKAQKALETIKWNYLAVPGIKQPEVASIATWIKELRENKNKRVKAILPHISADHEGVINFDTDDIKVGTSTYEASNYCSRIAGLLAGTPLDQSCTFSKLPEVNDVPHLSNKEFDAAIDSGKFVLMNDGEKVKVARGVNSLVTTSTTKTSDYKKIKLVDIMDQIHDDVTKTIADKYIGKFPNNYDNQVLLITALLGYARLLEGQSLLNKGSSSFEVDIKAKKDYLDKSGIDTSKMKDTVLKEYPAGDKVFLAGNIKILDAMEDFNLSIGM